MLSRLVEALIWMQALKPTALMMALQRSLWKLTSSMHIPQLQVNTQTNTAYFICLLFPFCLLYLFLFHNLSVYRLLLMEEYYDRILVHAVTVWYDQQVWKRSGAPAHHDTSEPQGGSRVWVYLPLTRLSCEETNPMHCVNADQRDVFFSLMLSLLWKISASPSLHVQKKGLRMFRRRCLWIILVYTFWLTMSWNVSLHISGSVDVFFFFTCLAF